MKDDEIAFDCPREVYFRSLELEKYFSTCQYYPFVDSCVLSGKTEEKKLFLKKLGTSELPRICKRKISSHDACLIKKDWKKHNSSYFTEYCIEEMDGAIKDVERKHDIDKSILIWKLLEKIIAENKIKHLADILKGKYLWFSQGEYKIDSIFESTCLYKLKNYKWILTKNGEWAAPSSITLDKLANDYNFSSYESKILIKSLEIGDSRFIQKK